jgi:hypothetical protein
MSLFRISLFQIKKKEIIEISIIVSDIMKHFLWMMGLVEKKKKLFVFEKIMTK